jgi:nicotinate-nucleotide pyrophosphorylase (carboxylating)
MYHELAEIWKNLLWQGLKEDGWPWDWTALGTRNHSKQKINARIIAKSEGIWAGQSLVQALNQIGRDLENSLQAKSSFSDGDSLKSQDLVVEITGEPKNLLALERPFLNLAAYVSGIATATQKIVKKVHAACPEHPPRVTLTRKTLPGYRDIAIHGVLTGGGHPHRVTLAGGVLIKENHIAASGGILKAVQGTRAVAPHGLKIEIEVRSLEELTQAIQAQAEGVLLDNFSPQNVHEALKLVKNIPSKPFIEVSGGLTESNISEYSIPGVDVLSLGSITHSVKSIDLSLLVDE